MSKHDHYLLSALRTLNNYERTQAGAGINLGCPEASFAQFMVHPILGPWIEKKYPISLAKLHEWHAQDPEDRNPRLDPYRLLNDSTTAVKVILYYSDEKGGVAEAVDWDGHASDVFHYGDNTVYQPAGQPGSLHDFENPKTIYLESLFLDDKAPTYHHRLSVWLMEQSLAVMKSEEGVAQGHSLERLSVITNADRLGIKLEEKK